MIQRRDEGSRLQGGIARKIAVAAATAGILALGAAMTVQADEVAKTFPISGHAKVRVETDDGAVRVSTGDIKQVEVRIVYTGYKLDKDLRVSTEQNGDSVNVIAKTSGANFWSWGVRHAS
ncbi:MAG: hypothetical protein WBW49_06255, partial [Candidatus Acidiferrum sp.]